MYPHSPDRDELLDERVAGGWRPTPTSTVDGEVILGHACHRFGRCPPDLQTATAITCG